MRQLCRTLSLEQIPQDAVIGNPSLQLSFQHLDSPHVLLFFLAAIFIGGEVGCVGGDCVKIALFSSFGQRQDLAGSVFAVQPELAE